MPLYDAGMWIFVADAFLSVVADPSNQERVIVRARRGEHIIAVFPQAEVWVVSAAEMRYELGPDDYRYKATMYRSDLKAALAQLVDDIQIGTFRNRITDSLYYDACADARYGLYRLSNTIPPGTFSED